MKKTVLHLLIILFCTLLFVQCKENCSSKQLADKKFTQDELQIIPYSGLEKITFKDSVGDSVCFTGQGRISTMNHDHEAHDWDGEGCQGDSRLSESVNLKFISENSDTTIDIVIRFFHAFGNQENDKILNLYFKYKDNDEHTTFGGTYSFEANNIFNATQFNWQTYYYITAHYDTLTLINHTYYNVYELSWDFSNILPEYQYLLISNVYYSISKGIVGYKKSSGTKWYLD